MPAWCWPIIFDANPTLGQRLLFAGDQCTPPPPFLFDSTCRHQFHIVRVSFRLSLTPSSTRRTVLTLGDRSETTRHWFHHVLTAGCQKHSKTPAPLSARPPPPRQKPPWIPGSLPPWLLTVLPYQCSPLLSHTQKRRLDFSEYTELKKQKVCITNWSGISNCRAMPKGSNCLLEK